MVLQFLVGEDILLLSSFFLKVTTRTFLVFMKQSLIPLVIINYL